MYKKTFKKSLFLLFVILESFSGYAQKLTVGKNSIQILDKIPSSGTLYTVVYKTDNTLLTNEAVIADAKAAYPLNVYSKNITNLIGDTTEIVISCKVANNATSTPVNYWVSYVYVDPCGGISSRISSRIEVKRRQTDESFTCNTIGSVSPFKINYLMYASESYYHTTKKYPLVITCHGNGQKGTNTLSILRGHFIPQKLESTAFNVEFVVVSPQANNTQPTWGNSTWMKEMIDSLKTKYRIDTTQIFIVGYDGGGEGVSTFIKNLPFSGIGTYAPILSLTPAEKCKLVNKKVWGYHNLDDKTVLPIITKNLISDINLCVPTTTITPKTTYFLTGGHAPDQALRTDSIFQFFLGKIK